jgi:TonB-dependent starch-binding outer membrane protein SusC
MILTKTIRLRLLLLWGSLSVLLFSTNTYAQTRKISGSVTEQRTSDPLPGAVVTVKSTKRAVITDASGMFTIDASTGDVLEVTMLGFQKADVVVGNSNSVKVKLTESFAQLAEVVVNIGYGTAKKSDVTGAISSIGGEDLRKTQPVTFDQALQGKIPGVVVQQASGQPGGAVSVQIRGLTSFGGGEPMYVIDGVIVSSAGSVGTASLVGNGANAPGANPLAGINPSDIESVDVLKDASATAIYGSQATNGVIVITTKRGKGATPSISYEGYSGFQQLPAKVPVMNLREFATFINARNTGFGWGFDTREEFVNPNYLGEGTDWQDVMFRNAMQSNHSLTLSGADARTNYLLSGSYFNQNGIAVGSNFKRASFRLNLDNKTTDWLKIGTSLQYSNIKDKVTTSTSNVISTALSQTADIAASNPDGSWGGAYNPDGWVNAIVNPFAIATINKDEAVRNQVFSNTYAEVSFTKSLVLKNEFSANYSSANQDRFFPTYTFGRVVNTNNSASLNSSQNLSTIIRNYLTYSHVFKTKYNVNVMTGHEAQLSRGESASASRNTFPSNNVQAVSSGDPLTAENSGTKTHNAQESYFGRLNLGLSDKYQLTGNLRFDGTSKFDPSDRWITTYSGAFAWKLHNEKFLKGVKSINELKLRVGYGLTNNQNVRDYAYTATLGTQATALSGVAQLTENVANRKAKWETTKNGNIGLDGNMFNWRLNFSVDVYNRRTDDLLMQVPLPLYSGTAIGYAPGALAAPYVNVGSMNNKGIEFRIGSTNIKTTNFTWRTDVNMSHNINKVLKLNSDGASLNGRYSKTVVGRSIGEFYGYMIDGGVYATLEELENHAIVARNGEKQKIGPNGGKIWLGDLKFKDKNGDGIIDENDQYFLGSPMPKFQIGLGNNFTYKNFDLYIFFNANIGNKVFNQMRVQGENPNTSFGYMKSLNNFAKFEKIDPTLPDIDPNRLYDPNSPTDREILNNYYVINPTTRIPGIRNDNTNDNNRMSDKYIEDGSYLKCKTISLGYTLPGKLIEKAHINSLRIYANVSNPFVITKYSGMDPEIGSWDPLNAGVDNGYYPQPRVFTFGANIKLTK